MSQKKNFGRKCSYRNCEEKSPSNYTFFGFPKDPNRYQQWMRMSQCLQNDVSKQSRFLCEKHFSHKYMSITPRRKTLLNTAVPLPYSKSKELIEQTQKSADDEASIESVEDHIATECFATNLKQYCYDDSDALVVTETEKFQSEETVIYEYIEDEENDENSPRTLRDKNTNDQQSEKSESDCEQSSFCGEKNYEVEQNFEMIEEDEILSNPLTKRDENTFVVDVVNECIEPPTKTLVNDEQIKKKTQKLHKFITFTDEDGVEFIQMSKAKYIKERQVLNAKIRHYRSILQRLKRELNDIV